jgi:hypothetical protein
VPRLGDQPYRTLTEPVELSAESGKSLRQTYIHLTESPFFSEAAARAKKQGFRSYEQFSAGHNAMVTQPKELAKILLELV